jgi:flagellar motor switch protein FliN/FliY
MNDKTIQQIELPEVKQNEVEGEPLVKNLDLIHHVSVSLEAKIGTASLTVGELFEAKKGSVIKLNETVDQPIELYLNQKLIAKGELVAVGDCFGIKIIEIENKK